MKNHKLKKVLIFAIVTFLIFAIIFLSVFFIPPSPKRIFNNTVKGVVELKCFTDNIGESYGTAEFVDNNGTLITNAHIVTYKRNGNYFTYDSYSIRFAFENNYRNITLIKFSVEKDIAIMELNDKSAPYNAMRLGNSDKLSFGNKVYAIGNGSNYGLSLTQGIISIPTVNIETDGIVRKVIQSDITITAGNSGGALLDKYGKLIGITTFRTKDGNGNVIYGLAYSIPINDVLNYLYS